MRADVTRVVASEPYIACAEGPCVVAVLKRERTRLPRLRILVLTRHVTAADQARALAAGADGVPFKPAVDGTLVTEMDRLPRWMTPSSPAPEAPRVTEAHMTAGLDLGMSGRLAPSAMRHWPT